MENFDLEEKDVVEMINKFKSINLNPFINGDNVLDYINYFSNHYKKCFTNGVIPVFNQKSVLYNNYFRLRQYNDIQDLNLEKEYSYPNPSFCKKIQRANLPEFPVFYCSEHPSTAILEMEKWNKCETKFVVSKWRKRNEDYEFLHTPTYPEQNIYKEILTKTINLWYSGSESNKNALNKFVLFLGDQLMQDDDYSVSANISHQLFYEKGIDVLSYPCSINMQDTNFAFSPQIIDKNILILDRIYIVELKPEQQLTLYQIGIFDKNKNVDWFNAIDLPTNDLIMQIFNNDFSVSN